MHGKAGAEELVQRISSVFDDLIAVAERHGGDVLKFRGDALLLLFAGERHAERAAGAASDMQWTIEEIGRAESSVGPVELRMSVGVHSGPCHFFLTAEPHRELLVAGPAATRVFELEDLATAGEIVVSAETAAQLDPGWLAEERDGARLMTRLAPGSSTIPPPPDVPGLNLEEYVPRPLRDHLAVASGEAEHRQVTVSFLKLSGTDAAIEDGTLLAMLDELAVAVGRACETYGLTWLESDIDVGAVKLYLTGGAPSSSGDDEEGMVRALRDVIAACPDLPLRAGVNRGHVFTGDIGNPHRRTYAVMGDAVNLAARLTARAKPGGILATADVLDRARTIYATETEPLLVKGKEQAVMAHASATSIGQRPKQQPDLTPIVGREAEVEQLQQAVEPRAHAAAAGGRARRRARHRQVAPRRRSCGRSRSASSSSTARRSSTPRRSRTPPSARRCASSSASRPTAPGGGRDDAAAVRDGDDARPGAVAAAARDPVRRGGGRHARGVRTRPEPRAATSSTGPSRRSSSGS